MLFRSFFFFTDIMIFVKLMFADEQAENGSKNNKNNKSNRKNINQDIHVKKRGVAYIKEFAFLKIFKKRKKEKETKRIGERSARYYFLIKNLIVGRINHDQFRGFPGF